VHIDPPVISVITEIIDTAMIGKRDGHIFQGGDREYATDLRSSSSSSLAWRRVRIAILR
jgi:hypothetical protein